MADVNAPQTVVTQQALSITADRGLTVQQLNNIATTMSSGNDDVIAALEAIAAAINAKPAA